MISKEKFDRKVKVLSTKLLHADVKKILEENEIILQEHNFIRIFKNDDEVKSFNLSLEKSQNNACLIMTSMNAWSDNLKLSSSNIKAIYCVGNKLREKLTSTTSNTSVIHTKSATDLTSKIELQRNYRYYYLCGSSRLDVIPNFFSDNGIELVEFHCYDTIENPKELSHSFDYSLFFSPSAVRSYFRNNTLDNSRSIALGRTTATELEKFEAMPSLPPMTSQLSMVEHLLKLIRNEKNAR